jgi:cation diffusion facilitator family transporter
VASSNGGPGQRPLERLLWLSIAAAVTTLCLKLGAWQATDSVGLLSDALESVVNLAAAVLAMLLLRWAGSPPDARHLFGHEKAEYFSAGAEGAFILLAAASIAWAALERLLHPQELEDVGTGLAIAAVASLVNLAVGLVLLRAGRRERSITLEADGRHLLTDVWTSVGVIVGVAAVALTGWERLDPIVALAVALNIVLTGVSLVRRAGAGLMDAALTDREQERLEAALEPYRRDGVAFHAVRTRRAGRRSFVSLHALVPGAWTVQGAHDLAERIESDVRVALPGADVTTHVEPLDDRATLGDASPDALDMH